jgi:CRP-like cAMP-binding protein
MLSKNERLTLASGSWFAGLFPSTGAAIVDAVTRRVFRPGDALFRQGDPGAGLYVLLVGEGRITGSSADGIPALIGILRPGDWTGFLAALDGGPYAFSAEMVTDGVAACLSVAAVERIFGSDVGAFRMLVAPELTIARRNYHFFLETHGRPPLRRVAERLM